MNVADYIVDFFQKKGVEDVFLVTGGQAMFLIDAVARTPELRTTCVHHEQVTTMAADAYGRIKGIPAIAMITAGPGSTNAITGVAGGYMDSAPMIVLSGQCNYEHVKYQEDTGIRQYGVQGFDMEPVAESISKYFVTIDSAEKAPEYVQKAWHLVTTGRPGPVWLDVPIDVQRTQIPDELLDKVYKFDTEGEASEQLADDVAAVIKKLQSAKNPIILAGQGVRLSHSEDAFFDAIKQLGIPVLTSRLGIDLLAADHPLYAGHPGTYGERAANFAVQSADVILTLGCRLGTSLIGHVQEDFGRNAHKIVVDIDRKELDKPGTPIHHKIHADLKDFLIEFNKQAAKESFPDQSEWTARATGWRKEFPVVEEAYTTADPINSYHFTKRLSELSDAEDMILVDTGSCFHVAAQAWQLKQNQRYLTTGGLSSMGYWVAAIGACLAQGKARTICITGDGSVMMNLQEFATIAHEKLPVKTFIFNNNGYLLIKHTQNNYMDGRLIGVDDQTGLWVPPMADIGKAFGIRTVRINSVDEMEAGIKEALEGDDPVICDVVMNETQLIVPRTSSKKLPSGKFISKPYEDMAPFLPEETMRRVMGDKYVEEVDQ